MKKENINSWIESYEKKKLSEIELLSKIFKDQKESDLPYLLSSLFTPTEIKSFAKRLLIVLNLKKEISQHEIADKLKVGVLTVTRGSREIKKGKFKFIKL